MSKKKRNKKYRGRHSVPDKPIVKRYQAESRNKYQIWFEDNKQTLKIRGIITLIVVVFAVLIISLVQWIF